jgi:hypothetical protein
LELVIGIDPVRDLSEVERLGLPVLDETYIKGSLVPGYVAVGFSAVEHGVLTAEEWSKLETSWARKLGGNDRRSVRYFVFRYA